jgi:hypothetical protein
MNATPTPEPQKQSHAVAITAIVATAIVLLSCIAGCTAVLMALSNTIH